MTMPTLMSIPPECRLLIFQHYFNDETNLANVSIYMTWDTPDFITTQKQCRIGKTSNLTPALFLVSRQIAAEARTQYHIHMNVSIEHSGWLEDVECFPGIIPAQVKNSVRSLNVSLGALYTVHPKKKDP